MKLLTLLFAAIAISGCDISSYGKKHENFSLFETSKGTVYLLNTTTGESKIIHSNSLPPRLSMHSTYGAEDGKIYEYQGSGKLKELSVREAADKIIEKH